MDFVVLALLCEEEAQVVLELLPRLLKAAVELEFDQLFEKVVSSSQADLVAGEVG